MARISHMLKALAAAAAAAAGTLTLASADGAMSTSDWLTVVLSVLGAMGVTYAVPNKQ